MPPKLTFVTWLSAVLASALALLTDAIAANRGDTKLAPQQGAAQVAVVAGQASVTPPQGNAPRRSFRTTIDLTGTKRQATLVLSSLDSNPVRASLQWKSASDQSLTTLFTGTFDSATGELRLSGREAHGNGTVPPIYDFTGRLDGPSGQKWFGEILRPVTKESLGTWSAKSTEDSGRRLSQLTLDWLEPESPQLQLLRAISDPLESRNGWVARRTITEEPAFLVDSAEPQVRNVARLHAVYFGAVGLSNANKPAGSADIERFRREMVSYLIESVPLDSGEKLVRARDTILSDDGAIADLFRSMQMANERSLALATLQTVARRRSRQLLVPESPPGKSTAPLEAKFCVAPGAGTRPTLGARVGVQFEAEGSVLPWYFIMLEMDADEKVMDAAWERRLAEWQLSRGLGGEEAWKARVRADRAEFERMKLGITKMALVPRALAGEKIFLELGTAASLADAAAEVRAYVLGADFSCLLLQMTGPEIKAAIETMTFDPPQKRTESKGKKSRKSDKR